MMGSPAQPAPRLRRLTVGDRWHYAAQGGIKTADGPEQPVRGAIDVWIEPEARPTVTGAVLLVFRQMLETVEPDGATKALPIPNGMFSFVQDALTGAASIVADNMGAGGAFRVARTPQVFYPGQWSSDTSYANRLEFDGGAFVDNTLAVVGQEWVESHAGRYLAWVAEITSESPATGRITGIDWWTPDLGAPVQFETVSTMPDAARLRVRATLTRADVAGLP